ncbi:MAG: hypothetical protein MUC50_02125 [Myxococcota bacterium]|jgi:hypothetical protein|nr:hypothetical protein [Myxococcota bacterium]
MGEVTIEVFLEGQQPSVFRFDHPVVRIGRGQECELRLCHEAVPRKLCSVWLEPGSRRVRLEPYPKLTNPLMHASAPLLWPMLGASVTVVIGPLRLVAYPSSALAGKGANSRTRRLAVIAASLTAASLAVAVLAGAQLEPDEDSSTEALDAALASSPHCPTPVAPCKQRDACLERIRLSTSRAAELAFRPDPTGDSRLEALRLLNEACSSLRHLGDPRAQAVCQSLDEGASALRNRHRTKVAALRAALSASDLEQAARLAEELARLVQRCSPDAALVLRQKALKWKGASR